MELKKETRTKKFRRLHPEYDKTYYKIFIQRHPNFISYQNEKRNKYRVVWSKRRIWKQKLELIKTYGNKCKCCDEYNPEFLTIDHKFGNGQIERKQHKANFYRYLKRLGYPKQQYQLLCMNCNFAKGHFKKCPHKN